MKSCKGTLDSVYLGISEDDLGKEPLLSLKPQLSGFVGDPHGSLFCY